MGLDAKVYCACFRNGTLMTRPPEHIEVYAESDGSLECRNTDLANQMEFDDWLNCSACEHEDGVLLSHRIGNLSQVICIREELEHEQSSFPILLSKVINNAFGGEALDLEIVAELQPELMRLDNVICADPNQQAIIGHFSRQMRELVAASHETGNPIVL